jgi:hypothetical protein
MPNWTKMLDHLVPSLGEAGVKALGDKLDSLSAEATEPWKKTVLSLTANAVESGGMKGIDLAWKAIEDLINDKPPKIDWADLEVASDVLAQLQNAEADRKDEIRDFFAKVSHDIGAIIGGLIKGLVSQ